MAHQLQPDSGYDSDEDAISYRSSSSSSSSSVSFDSSSESSSYHDDSKHQDGPNNAGVVSYSPSFASHLLSPPPLVSNRIDIPLQQQQQQPQQEQQQQLAYSIQNPSTTFRPRSRSTSSFSSPLALSHARQSSTSHISPLAPRTMEGMESNAVVASSSVAVATGETMGTTVNAVSSSRSSSSRRNSIVSMVVEPSEYAGQDMGYYPDSRPHSRPRSNTRRNSTSTPIRNATPVLGPVNRSTLAASEASSSLSMDANVTNRRNDSNGRSRSVISSTTSPRLVGLGANLAVGTVLPSAGGGNGGVYGSSSLSVLRERSSRRMAYSTGDRSCKQGPGHRKVRRWNNDLFIGIAKDISCSHARNPQKGARIANIYAEAEMDKARYTMPHVPTHRWTVFRALMEGTSQVNDTSADGTVPSESLQQETQQQEEDDWELGHKSVQESKRLFNDPEHVAHVRERFLQGEVSTNDCGSSGVMSRAAELRLQKRREDLFQNGHLMMQCNVNKRLLSIVMRTCRMPGFSRKVVDAFECVLAENMSKDGMKKTRQSIFQQDCDEVWEMVLVQKPFVTKRKVTLKNDEANDKKSAVTVRMIFSEDGSRAAFHRLLLHAVCQFHGLEVSSSNTSKGHKVLTVTGLCKGSHLRFLDFVSFDEEYDGNRQSSTQACLVKGMSTLQVQ